MKIRVACCDYVIHPMIHWFNFKDKIRAIVRDAMNENSDLIVFPELFTVELCSIPIEDKVLPVSTLKEQYLNIQHLHEKFLAFFLKLSKKYGVHILAGSMPVQELDGSFRNRAYFFSPQGKAGYQDKIELNDIEKKSGLFTSATDITIFDTFSGKIAICVGSDISNAKHVARLKENGAQIILNPSRASNEEEYHQINLSGRARAFELGLFVGQAFTLGESDWSLYADYQLGAAGIYGPIDRSHPDGILFEYYDDYTEKCRWGISDVVYHDEERLNIIGNQFNNDYPINVQQLSINMND